MIKRLKLRINILLLKIKLIYIKSKIKGMSKWI